MTDTTLVLGAIADVRDTLHALATHKRRPPEAAVVGCQSALEKLHALLISTARVSAAALMPSAEVLQGEITRAMADVPKRPSPTTATHAAPAKRGATKLRVVQGGKMGPLPELGDVMAMLDRMCVIDPGNTAGKGGAHVTLADLAKRWLTEERRYRSFLAFWGKTRTENPLTNVGGDPGWKEKRLEQRVLERRVSELRHTVEEASKEIARAERDWSSTAIYSQWDVAPEELDGETGVCRGCAGFPNGKHLRACPEVSEREVARMAEKLAAAQARGETPETVAPKCRGCEEALAVEREQIGLCEECESRGAEADVEPDSCEKCGKKLSDVEGQYVDGPDGPGSILYCDGCAGQGEASDAA